MNSLSQMFRNIFSDNSNIMLAAIISLLLVILFVLLLHLYAKWFIFQAQARAQRRRRPTITTVTVSDVLGPARFHHFHSFNIEDSPLSSSNTKGLDSSIVAAIPKFMYKAAAEAEEQDDDDGDKVKQELECVICLSTFEDSEMGRCLPKCGHGFHMECIDMWLNSHSNCPICRAPVVAGSQVHSVGNVGEGDDSAFVEIGVDDSIVNPNSEIRESENGNENGNDNAGVSGSVSEASFLLFGCSLKGILNKVFSSSNVNELHASEP
ncbi:hypothetical protein TanjilG_25186 [Lupinus angustifolius]|uniref:RING-type E3 ubiquitin transferase n=1 Tax=Lupinus angustifolius TaxID=3871 RepID=A0A1J7G4V2_LUPAN|nr:PREDICTED: RING-H2 finger protein ATL63-like [Lupinus angustifolius]OIV95515.1 hypothetical protein TanjilG_25186 [Lupinus angustifolius]